MKPRLRWCGTGCYFGSSEHEIGAWLEIDETSVHIYVPPAFKFENGEREAVFPFDKLLAVDKLT
jgi:hypothetical protein